MAPVQKRLTMSRAGSTWHREGGGNGRVWAWRWGGKCESNCSSMLTGLAADLL